jgi:hypothetical protein
MHFGLHLKKSGVISAEQLVAALEAQLGTLVPIGQLALEEGILSARDIFSILRAQSGAPSVHFGDMAIEMGLLTRDDVMRLLMIQSDRKRPIGEILVGQGVLSESQLKTELAAYRRALLQPKRPSATVKFVPMPHRRDVEQTATEAVAAVSP